MEQSSGVWRMVAAMAMSGTIGLFVLWSGQAPLTVVWFRCLIGGAALLAWLTWRGGWQRLDRRALAWLVGGAGALIVNWLCLFSAYRLCGIGVATVVYHVQPFFLIVLAALAQRELPAWHKLPWLLLALAGVALSSGIGAGAAQPGLVNGVLLSLAAALLYALATLATRKLGKLPPAQIAGLQLMLGALVLLPLAPLPLAQMHWQAWSSVAVLGLVHTGLMYNLMYAAFQRLRADTIAALSFIYPLVAVLVDVLAFHARPDGMQLLGMAMILAALAANARARPAAVPHAQRC